MTPWTDPTHSAAPPPRKVSRRGLYIPWAVAVVVAIAWSLWWLWLMHATVAGMDATAARLRAAGWRVAWASRQTGGYPFRLDVDVMGLEVADASGWGIAAPALKTEAFAFEPTHWVFYLPGGRVTVSRAEGGPIDVAARVLRGSVSGVGEGVPRIALEVDDARFAAGPGASPVTLAAAKNVQFYTRPGPEDHGATYLSIAGGVATPGGWLAVLSGGGPVSLKTDAIFGHASAFALPDLRQGLVAWTRAGGGLEIQHFELAAGPRRFTAASGRLSIGADGGLAGQIALVAGGLPLTLDFKGGEAWVGGVRVATAPRLF